MKGLNLHSFKYCMLDDSKTRPDFHYATVDIPVSKKSTGKHRSVWEKSKKLRRVSGVCISGKV